MVKAIIFGNLTIDENIILGKKFSSPGGSAYFCAKTLENLGIIPTIVARYGKDFPKKYLAKSIFYPLKASDDKTLFFRNLYTKNGNRYQWIKNQQYAEPIPMEEIPQDIIQNKEIIIVAPLINNITSKQINRICCYYSDRIKILLPQGLYRKVTKGGSILHQNWSQAEEIIPLFDIIIFSNKDYYKANKLAKNWSRKGAVVIVTKSGQGCNVYQRGQIFLIKARQVIKIVNLSGAGDIFAAAFAYDYYKSRKAIDSAIFANAVSAYSLRFMPNQLQYSYQDFVNFIRYPKY